MVWQMGYIDTQPDAVIIMLMSILVCKKQRNICMGVTIVYLEKKPLKT